MHGILKEVRERALQAERTVSAEALGQECAQHTRLAGRPMRVEQVNGDEVSKHELGRASCLGHGEAMGAC